MKRSLCALSAHSVSCVFLGLSVVVLAGCGADPKGRQPISGTVTYKGAPLASGTIEFSPLDSQSAASLEGAEIRDGKYSLPAKNGLTPGKYRVRISAADESQKARPSEEAPGVGPVSKDLIPKQYNVDSTLTAEVTPKGPNSFPFDLK